VKEPPSAVQVYLSLGSNLGDRAGNLRMAMQRMQESISIEKQSGIYETPPWGVLDQPAFLNQVVRGSTSLPPGKLLVFLKRIEREMGRKPTFRYGPRVIDLDILLYDDLQLERPRLTVPHPRLVERAFVLVPLAEIAPHLVIPGTARTVAQWLENTDQTGIELLPR